VDHGTWKSWGVLQIFDKQEGLRAHAGPDHWNDADMLEVGNGMSINEDRAHFSMWAMLTSPLIAGNDLRTMSKETAAILTDSEVIAVNQDPLGVQAFRYVARDGVEFWSKPLENGAWAFMALNRNRESRRVIFDWKAENVHDELTKRTVSVQPAGNVLRGLWKKNKSAGNTAASLLRGNSRP
jgi:alpha-galactosidase